MTVPSPRGRTGLDGDTTRVADGENDDKEIEMQKPTWKLAAVAGAVAGLGLGGFAIAGAGEDDPIRVPDVRMDQQSSVASPDRSGRDATASANGSVASPDRSPQNSSPDSSPPAPAGDDSPDRSPSPAPPPAPAPAPAPAPTPAPQPAPAPAVDDSASASWDDSAASVGDSVDSPDNT